MDYELSNEDFMGLMDELAEYLKKEKVFIQNPVRYTEVQRAASIAKELFKDYSISIKDDPIQMGALILCISGFDITIQGEEEIALFTEYHLITLFVLIKGNQDIICNSIRKLYSISKKINNMVVIRPHIVLVYDYFKKLYPIARKRFCDRLIEISVFRDCSPFLYHWHIVIRLFSWPTTNIFRAKAISVSIQ